jgi:GNAT superfamily N-acetyltransferase
MIREAGPDDRAEIEALLTARIAQAMFPLANLRAHGMGQGGFPSDHPHATRFWLVDGESLVALTQEGMLMALLDGTPDLTPLRPALQNLTVTGAVGPAASIRLVVAALGLAGSLTRKDADEPGFALDLARLVMPDLLGSILVPAAQVSRRRLVDWRAASAIESQGMPPEKASFRAEADIDQFLDQDSHRILLLDGQPVAMTGFNARLPEIVQVGAVYTPPEFRNRGHARTAVALHLAEARAGGARRAVLFAATPAAVRAYLAIGFQPATDFSLVLFRDPVTLPT